MATTTIATIDSLENALTAYAVSFEQVSKVTLVESAGKRYAIVESQTEAGKEYRVEYNVIFKVLSCNCPAGQEGGGCWHRRATLAQLAIDKMETRRLIDETIAQEASRYHEAVFCENSACPCHDDN